jgi:hypothetical protein
MRIVFPWLVDKDGRERESVTSGHGVTFLA